MTIFDQFEDMIQNIIEMAWTEAEGDKGLFAGKILAFNIKLGQEAYKRIMENLEDND